MLEKEIVRRVQEFKKLDEFVNFIHSDEVQELLGLIDVTKEEKVCTYFKKLVQTLAKAWSKYKSTSPFNLPHMYDLVLESLEGGERLEPFIKIVGLGERGVQLKSLDKVREVLKILGINMDLIQIDKEGYLGIECRKIWPGETYYLVLVFNRYGRTTAYDVYVYALTRKEVRMLVRNLLVNMTLELENKIMDYIYEPVRDYIWKLREKIRKS